MKITFEPTVYADSQHAVTVQMPSDDLNIWGVVDLLEAALLAYGFHPDTIAKVFNEKERK